jgi:ribonuclease HI
MIEVYIDAASAGDPGPSGAGIFIKGNGLNERIAIPLGIHSNHEAEFMALNHALIICVEKGYSVVSFKTDSQLVSQSMEKEFAKKEPYRTLLEEALKLSKKLDLFFIKWIPSAQNKVADELARRALLKNKINEKKNP